ncbi:MAG: tRNA guanosine(34) transglycosylase Tgt [Vampirovibrionia bacterium]
MFKFQLLKTDSKSKARAGNFFTPHGLINTPVFMPVGTNSTVKMLTEAQVRATGAQIMLSNSYHLYLRPGHKLVEKAGGLHSWMNWHRPILTDSGGFQVFSLTDLRKISDDGVEFRDPVNGSKHYINPEKSMEIQNSLGADIIMAFDECPPYPCDYDAAKAANIRTHQWLERCFKAHKRDYQALFPIVQGSVFEDLRKESADFVCSVPAHGYAIGGVSVGEPRDLINKIVAYTTDFMPQDKPRYLMGVGTPEDLLDGVKNGVDMFDCVNPTRIARHGCFFTPDGRGIIKNKQFEEDFTPLVEGCQCYACTHYTKAYIRHLYRVKEATAAILLSIHNIYTLVQLMKAAREAILADKFDIFYDETYKRLGN